MPVSGAHSSVTTDFRDFVLGEHDMRGGIPTCHFLEMTSSRIPGISAILRIDVIFREMPVSGAHSSVTPGFWNFVSGEHDMRGGIPTCHFWEMTSSRIPGISAILRIDVIFREMPVSGAHSSVTPGFWNFVSGEHDMRGGIPTCHFLEMTSSRIPGISAILGNDVIFQEMPVSGAHSSVTPGFWNFVSGEHDMRGGIPTCHFLEMTSSRIPGISAILGNDVISQEMPVSGAHSSVTPGFWNFVSGEHDMRGGIPSVISWKMTSFPRILNILRILAILGSDVIFQEIPVFGNRAAMIQTID
ncbi:unnamed protein product [Xylocopa violacea]|uniref:Uncharacterized protein n=1 Tax=Xylocopa violacea TaxID=135666 RepID=A0ABP1N3X9_XYLVO